MMATLHRIVYCSKGCIPGGEAEIRHELDSILSSARRKNSVVGVTGALLYNAGCFAQVLEGPQDAVEASLRRSKWTTATTKSLSSNAALWRIGSSRMVDGLCRGRGGQVQRSGYRSLRFRICRLTSRPSSSCRYCGNCW